MWSIKETVLVVTVVTSVTPWEMCRCAVDNIPAHTTTLNLPVTYASFSCTYSCNVPIFAQAKNLGRLNDPTIQAQSKQTSPNLHRERFPFGNYLILIKYAF